MPEFQLNVPGRKAHQFYQLDEFARGYVEAMFFTNCDTGDDRENLANELGVERLTKASVAAIKRDCDKFQADNAELLRQAQELEPGSDEFRYARDYLDDRRCGHLFWYARQGHGVTWNDDGDAACLDSLQQASEQAGEVYPEIYRGWIHYR